MWLERSGYTVPLDIEIYLRVADQPAGNNANDSQRRRRRRSSGSLPHSPSWMTFAPHNGVATHYVMPHSLHQPIFPTALPTATTHVPFIPPLSPTNQDSLTQASIVSSNSGQTSGAVDTRSSGTSVTANNRPNIHWAHIAFYYLIEQMPRWERFIFRYDKMFKSMTAIASINGALYDPHTRFILLI